MLKKIWRGIFRRPIGVSNKEGQKGGGVEKNLVEKKIGTYRCVKLANDDLF